MLNVERRVNIDAGVKDFFDVLIAFRMARPRGVRMRKLVNQDQGRPALEDGVDIQLGQPDAAILHLSPGQALDVLGKPLGLDAVMGFDVADDHIHPLGPALMGGLEHGVGLAHPGSIAKENLELAAAGAFNFDLSEQVGRAGA